MGKNAEAIEIYIGKEQHGKVRNKQSQDNLGNNPIPEIPLPW